MGGNHSQDINIFHDKVLYRNAEFLKYTFNYALKYLLLTPFK